MAPGTATAAQITGFDPADPAVQRDPYPYYRWLLRNAPVYRDAQGIWYVSRYVDVRTVMGEPRFQRAGIRDFWAELIGPGPLSEIMRKTLFFQDEPDHGRLRSLITPVFTPRKVRALQPRIAQIVDDLLAPVTPRGEMDLMSDFAYPLALTVIADLLGVPAADRDRLRAWSLAIGPTLDLMAGPAEIARGQAAMDEFIEYLRELISARRAESGEDLLRTLLAAQNAGDISMDEIISVLITLVFAGHETVTNQIGNGLLALLRHPDQLELLRAGPGRVPGAVEEFLRYDSSVQSNSRQLGEDVELGGTTLRRGEFVVALLGAANRDPAQFADPDRFDILRTDIQPMSFGAGMRYCLGAILARMEATAAFGRLIGLADLRLTVPDEALAYQRSTMFRGLVSLPIAYTPEPTDDAARVRANARRSPASSPGSSSAGK
jgi:cytochrome P450